MNFLLEVKCIFQWFQKQILHHILPTNSQLYKMGRMDSDGYGSNVKETVLHLFVECQKVRHLWSNIENWLLNKGKKHSSFKRKYFTRVYLTKQQSCKHHNPGAKNPPHI